MNMTSKTSQWWQALTTPSSSMSQTTEMGNPRSHSLSESGLYLGLQFQGHKLQFLKARSCWKSSTSWSPELTVNPHSEVKKLPEGGGATRILTAHGFLPDPLGYGAVRDLVLGAVPATRGGVPQRKAAWVPSPGPSHPAVSPGSPFLGRPRGRDLGPHTPGS